LRDYSILPANVSIDILERLSNNHERNRFEKKKDRVETKRALGSGSAEKGKGLFDEKMNRPSSASCMISDTLMDDSTSQQE
jgi:hypothetical protein